MMEFKILGDICNIVSGGTPPRSKSQYWDNGNIPWIKIRDIKSKYIEDSEESITIEGLNNSSTKLLAKGTVLYTIFATLGEVGILKIDACTNQAIAGLTVKDETKILPEYLYYYLKSKKNIVNKLGRGAAQNNINLSMLKSFEIEIIDIIKQNNIIRTLNYVDNLIKLKSRELELLDELVKARFVELFGDVRSNNNYPNVLFSECVEHSLRGPFGSDMKKSLYVPKNENTIKVYIQINAIQKNENLGDYYISKEYYDDKMYKFEVFPNEYIITCDGTLGKLLKLSKNMEKGVISSSLLKLKLNYSLITDQYFEYVWNLCLLPQLISEARNACLVHLPSMKVIGSKKIQLPPLELQNQFADFVKEVDKSRLEVQKSLKKTQELFDSLMQKYFG